MARSINDSLQLLRSSLGDITTSLGDKGVTARGLKASQVPDKIREIELGPPATIYGVKIIESTSDPEARVQYTDDAIGMTPIKVDQSSGTANYNGWDKTWIFDKIYPCMVKSNGQIDYKLNPEDYSQKLEGGSSDVTNTNYDGNAMVCVEKFYTKFSMDGENECIQISDVPKDGFEAIGFIREDGSEADRVFLPMFMGSYDSSSKLRSISGQDVKYRVSFTDFRTAAQKNGSGYDIETWAMHQMFQAVYYILMKNCNPKAALGDGRNSSEAKTGILNNKGSIAYDPSTKCVKFMHVEDFTCNYSSGMMRWEAGILCKNKEIYVRMKPPYSGTDTSTYEKVSDHVYTNGAFMSKMKCSNKYGRYPIECNGSNSTYESSFWYDSSNTSGNVCISRRGRNFGVAGLGIYVSASLSYSDVGAALTLIPPE